MSLEHRVPPLGIAWVAVSGDEQKLGSWLDGAQLPVRCTPGAEGVAEFGIATDSGDLVVSASSAE